MQIVKNGTSACSLVYSEESKFAAEECRHYVRLITGAVLPMIPAGHEAPGSCLFIGDRLLADRMGLQAGKLPEQGFCIRTRGGSGFIIGADKLAALHGVYAFLEKWGGCHWCAPGNKNETVPRNGTLSLEAADYRAAPDLPLRGMHLGGRLWAGGKDIEQLDWMARNRMNFCAMGEIDFWPEYKEHALREIKQKRGMTMMIGCHTWTDFLNPNRYFKKHPEYYALVHGERRNPLACKIGGGNAMVCATHPDVPKIMAENVIMFLSQNPEVDILGLSQNDGGNWCECPRCMRLEPLKGRRFCLTIPIKTKSNLFLINKIVENAVKVFPKKRFAAMAYSQTLEPPDDPGFRLHPNLDLIVALFERAYDRPLNKGLEPGDWHTMHYDTLPVRYTCYPELLRRWRQIVQGRIYFHKYTMGHGASRCLPWPIYTTIVEDSKLFRQLGLDGFYAQYPQWPRSCHNNPDDMAGLFREHGLNFYLAARAGYDTGAKADQLIGQYCRNYYNRAAKPMAEYYAMLDKAGQNIHLQADANDQIQIFTPAVIEAGKSLLKKAARSAGDRSVSGRIRHAWCSFHYACEMASIRNDMLEILRNHLSKSRIGDVVRLMKRIARKETILARFIKRNMEGKGLFYVGEASAKRKDVDFIHSIKNATYMINTQVGRTVNSFREQARRKRK